MDPLDGLDGLERQQTTKAISLYATSRNIMVNILNPLARPVKKLVRSRRRCRKVSGKSSGPSLVSRRNYQPVKVSSDLAIRHSGSGRPVRVLLSSMSIFFVACMANCDVILNLGQSIVLCTYVRRSACLYHASPAHPTGMIMSQQFI
jgi:hypothetical protein